MRNINKEILNKIISEIKEFFVKSKAEKAVIGISGGKDSSIVAALCVKALGKENVIGVLMPNKYQIDISDSEKICKFLNIKKYTVDIYDAYDGIFSQLIRNGIQPSSQSIVNVQPRIRMSALYAIAQSVNGRVINTTNACEAFVGYGTLYGDVAGDFAPLKYLTVDEVYKLGDLLNLPKELVYKTPSDGLTGKSDEENLGVSYSDIGEFYKDYTLYGKEHALTYMPEKIGKEKFNKILELHNKSQFKRDIINIPGIII